MTEYETYVRSSGEGGGFEMYDNQTGTFVIAINST